MNEFMAKSKAKDAEIERIKYLCENDLKFLCTVILGMEDWQDGLHDELAEYLQKLSKRKLILIPRHHLKSSIVSVGFTIQQILKNHNIRILLTNATLKRCEEMMYQIQGYLTERSILPQLYGDFTGKGTRWTVDQFTIAQRTKGAIKEPTISIASLTTNVTGGHYDLILNDDLVERGNIGTAEQIQKVKDFFKDCLNLSPRNPIITVGTRWNINDLYGDLLKRPDFDAFVRKAVDDSGTVVFPNMVCKDRTDPDWEDKICLEFQKEILGPFEFSCQFMNNPIDESAIEFKDSWIQEQPISGETASVLNFEPGYLTVDPALRLKETNDPTGFVVSKIGPGNLIYILEAYSKKTDTQGLIDEIFKLVALYNIKTVGIETVGAQLAIIHPLKQEMRLRKVFFKIDELKTSTRETKAARIRGLIPYYANGQVIHRLKLSELKDQLIQFPRALHDDVIDALAYQIPYWKAYKDPIKKKRPAPYMSVNWFMNQKTTNRMDDLFKEYKRRS